MSVLVVTKKPLSRKTKEIAEKLLGDDVPVIYQARCFHYENDKTCTLRVEGLYEYVLKRALSHSHMPPNNIERMARFGTLRSTSPFRFVSTPYEEYVEAA